MKIPYPIFYLLLFLACGLDEVPETIPAALSEACFTPDKTSCMVNDCTINFNASCSNNAVSYDWDFGDNTSGSGVNPNHTYAALGTYTVTLTTKNSDNKEDTDTKTITVLETQPPPTADFNFSIGDCCGSCEVEFTSTSNGDITNYNWDFGDGNVSTEQNPTHTFQGGGTFEVILTVSGSSGENITSKNLEFNISESSFSNLYPEGSTSEGFGITNTSDGGYAISGRTSSGNVTDAYLLKIDNNGNTVSGFPKFEGGSIREIFYSIDEADNEDLIMTGITRRSGSDNQAYFNRTTKNGNSIVNFPKFLDEGITQGDAVKQLSDGNIVVVGTELINNNTSDLKVWKMNASANLQSGFPLEIPINLDSRTRSRYQFDVVETANQELIVIGSILKNTEDIFLLKIDESGNTVNGFPKFYDLGSATRDFGKSIVLTKNNELLITGTSDNNVFLLKLDLEGNEINGFPKYYDLPTGITYNGTNFIENYGCSVAESCTGNILLTGRVTHSGGVGSAEGYWIMTDADGDVMNGFPKLLTSGYGNSNGINYVTDTPDGGFIMTGIEIGKLWVRKIDANGN